MKKKIKFWSSLFLSVMILSGCSNSSDSVNDVGSQPGSVAFSVQFSGAQAQKTAIAAQSTAIPATSWDNIKSLQFLLYNADGVVKYADMITSLPDDIEGNKKQFTYTDVPVGTYTLVVVANASTPGINTSIDGGTSVTGWNTFNVRKKNISELLLTHKETEFPEFAKGTPIVEKNKAYSEPSEIFMASAQPVVVEVGKKTTISDPLKLTREVSLMRLRLNVKDPDSGVDNKNTVDFTKNVSVMIMRLPENMSVKAGNDGGVSKTSDAKSILSISGENVFKTEDPTSGYKPTTILSGNFSMWRDVVVFPNYADRSKLEAQAAASSDRQYLVIVSALAKAGHILANGSSLKEDATIYWSGLVKENFIPNVIREVNLTLKSGGDTTAPEEPRVEGGLIIELSTPQPWDSNIVSSDIIV